MNSPSTPNTPRRQAVNLTIGSDIIAEAKRLNLNISQAAEAGMREAIRKKREADWCCANSAALEAHNRRVDQSGPLIAPDWDIA